MKNLKRKTNVVERYVTGKNTEGRNPWYVLDLLTTECAEKDPRKGWYRLQKRCQLACDILNGKDRHEYFKLPTGFVARKFPTITEELTTEDVDLSKL